MAKAPSRTKLWYQACEEAQAGLTNAEQAFDQIQSAFQSLVDIQQEYADWLDNLPENLQQSALGDKLNEMANFDLDIDVTDYSLSDLKDTIEGCEGADLPLGFGRD